jgi:branched-chain amino acid aminotransferase
VPVVSIDGVITPPERAVVSVFDRGLLYGDGCFEVLRTWGGRAVDLEAHLARLYDTAAFLQLRAMPRDELAQAVREAIAVAGEGDHRIRIVLTRGPGGLHLRLAELPRGKAIVIVEPLGPQPSTLTLAVVRWELPRHGRGHKTLAYLDQVIARELAREAGADEAVRLDPAGQVVEGATCNVFAVVGGCVVTPPVEAGALPGIVRGRVLALCARDALPTAVRPLTLDELRAAPEVFVTSSLRGVVAVTALDGAARSTGQTTVQIASAYRAEMRSHASRIA